VAVRTIQTPGAASSTNTCRPANSFPSEICPLAPITLIVTFIRISLIENVSGAKSRHHLGACEPMH
jgi:hypothetical protein